MSLNDLCKAGVVVLSFQRIGSRPPSFALSLGGIEQLMLTTLAPALAPADHSVKCHWPALFQDDDIVSITNDEEVKLMTKSIGG